MAGYQGYGQSAQAYGNPQLQQPPQGEYGQYGEHGKNVHSNDRGEQEFYQDRASKWRCTEKGGFGRVDNWCIFLCSFGGLLCLISTFMPVWRVDEIGTTFIQSTWNMSKSFGFESKGYGVYHVKGSWSQSWTTLAQAACDVRNLAQIMGIGQFTWEAVTGGDPMETCSGSESCQGGFGASMHMRCLEYQSMMRISLVTFFGTFMSFVLIIAGTLVVSMSKRRKSGGVAFGLYMFAGVVLFITNTVWAFVTDAGFKSLSSISWYPYPSLSIGWYMHVSGYCLILISATIFGSIVMPDVWNYDGAQEKLDKKKHKIEKRKARDQKYKQKREDLKAMVAQQQHFPQPPGVGWKPWAGQAQGGYQQQQQPSPYGQPPPPQPVPLGFGGDQRAPTYGQGGAQPAPAAADFGVGAAQNVSVNSGGYGAAPGYGAPAQAGYVAPPAGYGAPPQGGGYGAPPPAGGYGAPPPAGGYGAPPQGGYLGAPAAGAPERKPSNSYNWPAKAG